MFNFLQKVRETFGNSIQPVIDDNEVTEKELHQIQYNSLCKSYNQLQEQVIDSIRNYLDIKKGIDLSIKKIDKKFEDESFTKGDIEKRKVLFNRIDNLKKSYKEEVEQLRSKQGELNTYLKKNLRNITRILEQTGDFVYRQYDSLGKKRSEMPQIDKDSIDDFLIHFSGKSNKAKVKKVTKRIDQLLPTQSEFDEDKILSIMYDYQNGNLEDNTFLISKEGRILDGHHRWCALCELEPDKEVTCYQVNLPMKELLRRAKLMKISRKEDVQGNEVQKADKNQLINSYNTIKEAYNKGKIDDYTFKKAYKNYQKKLDEIEKAYYKDNPKNRKLGRVGKWYGGKKEDNLNENQQNALNKLEKLPLSKFWKQEGIKDPINIDKVLKNDVPEDTSILDEMPSEEKTDQLVKEGKTKSAMVKISDLIPTQYFVEKSVVEKKIKEGYNTNDIIIVSDKGKKYIVDGHHTIAAEKLKGNRSITNVRLIDKDDLEKSELQKSLQDIPNYRLAKGDKTCGNCGAFKQWQGKSGYCEMFDTKVRSDYVCDDWVEEYVEKAYYKDNPKNRKLGRVGKWYGGRGEEEKKENNNKTNKDEINFDKNESVDDYYNKLKKIEGKDFDGWKEIINFLEDKFNIEAESSEYKKGLTDVKNKLGKFNKGSFYFEKENFDIRVSGHELPGERGYKTYKELEGGEKVYYKNNIEIIIKPIQPKKMKPGITTDELNFKIEKVKLNKNTERAERELKKDREKYPEKFYKAEIESKNFADVILTSPAGNILLLKRNKHDELGPGEYALPGGTQEANEESYETAARELQEETNLSVDELTYERTFDNGNGTSTDVYSAFTDRTDGIILDINEHEDYIWVSPDDIDQLKTFKDTGKRVREISSIEKGKKANVGEVREWKSGKYQKTTQGWKPVSQGGEKGKVNHDKIEQKYKIFETIEKAEKYYEKDAKKSREYLSKESRKDNISKSVRQYTFTGHDRMRKYLANPEKRKNDIAYQFKNKERLEEYFNELEEKIQNVSTFINDNKIQDNLNLVRYVNTSLSPFFNKLSKGDIYEDYSFSSCALIDLVKKKEKENWEEWDYGDFKINILCEKGSNVANIANEDEFEYVIDKGSKFEVLEKTEGQMTVKLLND